MPKSPSKLRRTERVQAVGPDDQIVAGRARPPLRRRVRTARVTPTERGALLQERAAARAGRSRRSRRRRSRCFSPRRSSVMSRQRSIPGARDRPCRDRRRAGTRAPVRRTRRRSPRWRRPGSARTDRSPRRGGALFQRLAKIETSGASAEHGDAHDLSPQAPQPLFPSSALRGQDFLARRRDPCRPHDPAKSDIAPLHRFVILSPAR